MNQTWWGPVHSWMFDGQWMACVNRDWTHEHHLLTLLISVDRRSTVASLVYNKVSMVIRSNVDLCSRVFEHQSIENATEQLGRYWGQRWICFHLHRSINDKVPNHPIQSMQTIEDRNSGWTSSHRPRVHWWGTHPGRRPSNERWWSFHSTTELHGATLSFLSVEGSTRSTSHPTICTGSDNHDHHEQHSRPTHPMNWSTSCMVFHPPPIDWSLFQASESSINIGCQGRWWISIDWVCWPPYPTDSSFLPIQCFHLSIHRLIPDPDEHTQCWMICVPRKCSPRARPRPSPDSYSFD